MDIWKWGGCYQGLKCFITAISHTLLQMWLYLIVLSDCESIIIGLETAYMVQMYQYTCCLNNLHICENWAFLLELKNILHKIIGEIFIFIGGLQFIYFNIKKKFILYSWEYFSQYTLIIYIVSELMIDITKTTHKRNYGCIRQGTYIDKATFIYTHSYLHLDKKTNCGYKSWHLKINVIYVIPPSPPKPQLNSLELSKLNSVIASFKYINIL